MSDELPDTPPVGRGYCPECETETDPTKGVLNIARCWQHQLPEPKGTEDERVPPYIGPIMASGDADGSDCRRVAAMIRKRES